MSSKKTNRKVKRRSNQINLTKGKSKIKSRPSKQQVVAAAKRLNRTKTRRYIIYGIVSLVLMQLVKYIIYNFVYVGTQTPGGVEFLLIIYLQTGLMLVGLGFFTVAAFAYLRSLKN